MPDSVHRVLRIRIHDLQGAINLSYVMRVLPLMAVQRVPGGPNHLVGLMDYRGEILPVVDLGAWLGIEELDPYTLDTPVLLCSNGENQVTFVVSEVIQVEPADPSMFQMQGVFGNGGSDFVAALNLPSGQVLLLDLERIMRLNLAAADSGIPETTRLPSARPAS